MDTKTTQTPSLINPQDSLPEKLQELSSGTNLDIVIIVTKESCKETFPYGLCKLLITLASLFITVCEIYLR